MSVEFINFLDMPYELQLESRNWRNQDNVAGFFKIKNIDEETHIKWLKKLALEKPSIIAFFIKSDENYVGVTYFHSIDYEKR